MMLRRLSPITEVLFVLVLIIVNGARAEEFRSSGPIKVEFSRSELVAPVIARMGNLRVPIEFRVGSIDVVGTYSLAAVPIVRNLSQAPIFFAAYMAFFDSDGILIAACGNWKNRPVAANQQDRSLVGLVPMEKAQVDKIASYQVIVYVSARMVGSDADTRPPQMTRPATMPSAPYTPVSLAVQEGSPERSPVMATLGNRLSLQCRFHVYRQEGWRLWGGGTLVNTSGAEAGFSYCVAFFDKDGFLAAAADLDFPSLHPNQSFTIQSPITLPRDKLESIIAYEAVLYEQVRDAAKPRLPQATGEPIKRMTEAIFVAPPDRDDARPAGENNGL